MEMEMEMELPREAIHGGVLHPAAGVMDANPTSSWPPPSAVADSSTRHKQPSPTDHPDRALPAWDHAARGAQRNHHYNGGGGSRGNAFAARRRGGYDGFLHRGPPPMGMAPYMRGRGPPPPMPVPPPFPASPMQPFAGPMLFHEMPSPVSPMYYFAPPEALPFPPPTPMVGPPAYPYFLDPQPHPEAHAQDNRAKLLKQIDFYFSKDNLCRDVFLRRNMDDHGWVHISLIAGFKKFQQKSSSALLLATATSIAAGARAAESPRSIMVCETVKCFRLTVSAATLGPQLLASPWTHGRKAAVSCRLKIMTCKNNSFSVHVEPLTAS